MVKKEVEAETGARNKKIRAFKMDRDFYNIYVRIRKVCDEKYEIFFSNEEKFDQYKHGRLLSAIVDQFSSAFEELTLIRAQIDYKFIATHKFFKAQQFIYLGCCVIPFMILQSVERHSSYIIPCLVLSQIGQFGFLAIEYTSFIF